MNMRVESCARFGGRAVLHAPSTLAKPPVGSVRYKDEAMKQVLQANDGATVLRRSPANGFLARERQATSTMHWPSRRAPRIFDPSVKAHEVE